MISVNRANWGLAVTGTQTVEVGVCLFQKRVSLRFLQVKEAAVVLAAKMRLEDGVEGAVRAFHKHLPKDVKTAGHKMLWGLTRKRAARGQPKECGCFG